MTLAAGTKLGPYEILAPIGAGGMGEVYRAKDPRLGREVAIKVLPASFSQDADRLKRFEQEARAAGVLNHPGITAVYDIGTAAGAPYIVTELLEGETLRNRLLAGALSVRKAIDYAVQIAKGLAAAHEKGIVHRDLKPENLFLTKDGRVKILDFGLAKLKPEASGGGQTDLGTVSGGTEPGVVLGTMGYMSPEQVRGKAADKRSDLFAFGAILYEMLSGQRAFRGETAADTITAILTKEPPDLAQTNKEIHPGLDRIVRHCLEKNPEERFESARDVAFDLEALSGVSSATAAVAAAVRSPRGRRLLPLVGIAALAVGAVAGLFAGKKLWSNVPPSFHQLTFRRGQITSARFAPDGQTVLYTAGWEGAQPELFVNRLESPESRPFGLTGAEVLAISRSGEMAVSLDRQLVAAFIRSGTLARMSLSAGTAPRSVAEDVQWADWGPDGASLALVRDVAGRNRLEFPIGKVLYQTAGWISHPRISPKGDLVAFVDHPARGDDGGTVAVADPSGKVTHLSPSFESAEGLAWSPGGHEIWFTAALSGGNRALWAVTRSGGSRVLVRGTAPLTIQDVFADGRVLMLQDTTRVGMVVRLAGEPKERDLSWLDWSIVADLSPDGKNLVFIETGEGGGPGYSVYLRSTEGATAVRLGEGAAGTLSPDGKWVASVLHSSSEPQVALFPTGAGESTKLPKGGLFIQRPDWLPDGKNLLFTANEVGHGARVYVQDLVGGKPRAITPEGYRSFRLTVSPDAKFFAAKGPDDRFYLYPIAGGEPTALPGLSGLDVPVRWSADGRSLFVYRRGVVPAKAYRVDVATGRAELWKELMPADAAGVTDIVAICPTPDGRSYVYSYNRLLSNLYIVEGLK
jgi:eukaryotic-like serine/threonine-protein kinase